MTTENAVRIHSLFGITEIEGGFPHSEIRGSKLVRSSPRLIAAYHVLHRLSAPRHPPNTLKALDRSHYRCPPFLRSSSSKKSCNFLGFCVRQRLLRKCRQTFSKTPVRDGSIERPFASNISETVAVTRRSQLVSSIQPRPESLDRMIGYVSSSRCQTARMALMQRLRNLLLPGTNLTQSTVWWSQTGSNRRPHACKARALPTELWPQSTLKP